MRSEKEMMDLILNTAIANDNIRIVELNGSRVHDRSKRDPFQDYDVIYYVNDMWVFLKDHSWVNDFGERILMQMPDQMIIMSGEEKRHCFAYLMLFTDGNRIDLTLTPITFLEESLKREESRKILLDKDNRLDTNQKVTMDPFLISRPGQKEFCDCSNEFWWVSTYIAKALWREELTLAKQLMEGPVRDMLMKLVGWHIGVRTEFTVSSGKGGKYIQEYVESGIWDKLVLTYPDGQYENIWKALFDMGDLFDELTIEVGKALDFDLPDDASKVRPYLHRIHKLPEDCKKLY